MLVEWNATATDDPIDRSIPELFESQATAARARWRSCSTGCR